MQNKFKIKNLDIKQGDIFCDNVLIEDKNKNKTAESDNIIVVGYAYKNSISRVLSNLYPMQFKFRGKKVASIESVLQGIKYKDKKTQNLVFKYAGIDAYHTRACNNFDFWGNSGKLWFQGKEMDRCSAEYQNFLDELYLSAFKNKLYFRALISSGNKYLLHHIGGTDEKQTVLTRFEYESRLNSLQKLAQNKYL